MASSARWFGAAALSGLALLGLLVPQTQAQFRRPLVGSPFGNPAVLGFAAAAQQNAFNTAVLGRIPNSRPIFAPMLGTPGVGVNTNYWMNPYTTLQQRAFNTGVLGSALSTIPPYALGYGGNPLLNAAAYSPYGYGGASLLAGGYGGYGGYGYAGYGYGYAGPGTNPYYGYERGAADITSANAQYEKTIQEARELKAKARNAELDARRRAQDQEDYERKRQPTAVTLRDQDEATALNEARDNAPLSSILDGSALNTLLREAQKQQKAGRKAQSPGLDEGTLRGVNLTPGNTRGNVGLLKDGGKLRWPPALEGPEFADARKTINQLVSHAVQEVTFNHPVEPETLKDLRAALADMTQRVRDSVGEMSPTEYISAQRYLTQLSQAVTALSDPKVSNYFNKDWAARGKNVAELVKFMTDNGLVFAPSVPGDENAYRAMYDALASYDAELAAARK
jgi:hypothetical protein